MSQTIIKQQQKKPKKKLKLPSKKVLIVCGAIATVAILVLVWWMYVANQSTETVDPEAEEAARQAEELSIANNQSDHDYETGRAILEERAKSKETDTSKVVAYLQLSQLATNNQEHQSALDYALEADRVGKTNETARIVAHAAVKLESLDLAREYFNIAIDRTGSVGDEDTPENNTKQYFISETRQSMREAGL